MSFNQTFQTGYLKIAARSYESIFLSVTPGFELGPGIERDGITQPRMTDPHTVPFCTRKYKLDPEDKRDLPPTVNPYVQRAGTWTLFNHVHSFIQHHGKAWRIIGVQSCGDLTMNPWHVALIHSANGTQLCRLNTDGDDTREPTHERTYRCLVKWRVSTRMPRYEFIDLKFFQTDNGYRARIKDPTYLELVENETWLREKKVDRNDITDHIEFALSGKPIVEHGRDLPLANAIDRFQDVRHVFNVPTVPADGAIGEVPITELNFGEHLLFTELNARRAALNSAVLVKLRVGNATMRWETIRDLLIEKRHYRISSSSPTCRGEFRRYSEDHVEIFYPHNVYPFGVLGGKSGELVCLASGGLSGRVGNTLEGMTRIAYDFFGCHDAVVLDEGFDTFHVVNPNNKTDESAPDHFKYDNLGLLKEIAKFVRWRVDKDHEESIELKKDDTRKHPYAYEVILRKRGIKNCEGLKNWPLNRQLLKELDSFCRSKLIQGSPPAELDTLAVSPNRSQMRAVMIFAVREMETTSR